MKNTDKQALREWQDFIADIKKATKLDVPLTPDEREKHRMQLEETPIEWIRFFFPHYAKYPFAPFHKKAIKRIIAHREWFEVLSWARELAKSTTVMFIVLFLVLTKRKRNVIMTSNSFDNAERLLAPYKAELEANERIKAYYGEQPKYGAWQSSEFITTGGASFRALGAGQSPRGARNEAIRPDVLLVDDFDTDEECKNPDVLQKKWEWWEKALYPTRSISEPTTVIFCGNIIAKDCCVKRAGEMADHWDIVNIRDKNGTSTWPEKNTEELIDKALRPLSTKTIQGEYYNNPISEGEVFKEITYGKIPPLSKFRFLVQYGDPAPGENKTKQSSTKSVVLLGIIGNKCYIVDAHVDRATNAEFVSWYSEQTKHLPAGIPIYRWVENNSLQDPFFQQALRPLVTAHRERTGEHLYIQGDTRKKPEKFARIEANLEPLNREGNLIFNADKRDNPHFKRAEEQFLLLTARLKFPADFPDCVEGGYYICRSKQTQYEPPKTVSRKAIRSKSRKKM